MPRTETTPPKVLDNLRVLIVDDSADTLEMLHRLLELEGAKVSSAGSAVEALDLAAESDFDVIVSDISMPAMDGFELLRRLRAMPRHERVPVLAMTGFGRAEDAARAQAEGFVSHLAKPVDVDELLAVLQQLPL